MVSLSTLDEEKRDVLTQYQSITQTKDFDEALGQLIEHDWNLERAVQNIYENNPTEKREELEEEVASSTAARSIPSSSSTAHTTIHNTFRTRAQARPFSFLSILLWPFGMAWNITWSIISLASKHSLARIISRPTITNKPRDPRVLAFEFIELFETKYGQVHVEFFKGGYSQALEKARKDLRFMLVILQSDDHDNTDEFNKNTLTSTRFIEFIKQKNILVWGGNVRESEAHKVSYTLQATTYPFLALITLQTSIGNATPKMAVIERMEGTSHPEELISQIEIAIDRHGAVVNRLKNERSQRDMERQLLKDQDAAYHQSLKADQEKTRLAEEEKEVAARAQEQILYEKRQIELLKEKREQYIQYLYANLPKEPEENAGKVAKLSFRLANGDRVIRKFNQNDTVDTLYRFVEIYPLLNEKTPAQSVELPTDYVHKYKFTIHSPYPRMEYEPNQDIKLCDIKSLWPSATLVVDAVDDEEEED
ncbi:hypothetical protein MFLAVUS_005472 [Mucor flavus]|uniref:UBX domain-containing protein n=1 Tax=Mucor flavus TaxID=439312 RepID=A0ABP9YYV0_9FUNG